MQWKPEKPSFVCGVWGFDTPTALWWIQSHMSVILCHYVSFDPTGLVSKCLALPIPLQDIQFGLKPKTNLILLIDVFI